MRSCGEAKPAGFSTPQNDSQANHPAALEMTMQDEARNDKEGVPAR
jgi:hypothetical protein